MAGPPRGGPAGGVQHPAGHASGRTGALGWWLGLISLFGFFILGNIFGIIATAIVHNTHARDSLTARLNTRNALNWSISFGLYTLVLVGVHILLLYLLGDEPQYNGQFFPIGVAMVTWSVIGIYHVIGSIVCAVRAGQGKVAMLPGALPFVRRPR